MRNALSAAEALAAAGGDTAGWELQCAVLPCALLSTADPDARPPSVPGAALDLSELDEALGEDGTAACIRRARHHATGFVQVARSVVGAASS